MILSKISMNEFICLDKFQNVNDPSLRYRQENKSDKKSGYQILKYEGNTKE